MTTLQENELIKLIELTRNPILTYVSSENYDSTIPYKISLKLPKDPVTPFTYKGDIQVPKFDGLLTQHISTNAQIYLGLDCNYLNNPNNLEAGITAINDLGKYMVEYLSKFIKDMAIKNCCIITEETDCNYVAYYQNGIIIANNGCFILKGKDQDCTQHITNMDYTYVTMSNDQALGLLNENLYHM